MFGVLLDRNRPRRVTKWKMDMMADNFIEQVWKSRKDDLLSLADEITAYYKEDAKKNNENNLLFIDSQIEKLKKKTKNLLEIYTDGEISKAEYSETRKSYDEEIKALEEQKSNLTEQTEHYSRSMEDLANITKALGEMIDLSDENKRNKFLEKFLLSVVPENDRFYWNYRLNGQNETICEYSVTGNKKNPTIILGNPEEASDEDASDIHNNEDVFYFNTESGCDQKSTPHKEQLHRLLSLKCNY